MLPELELLELVWLDWLSAAVKVMLLSAASKALLPAVMAEPWTVRFDCAPAPVPPPVAMMLTLLPADIELPLDRKSVV